jgi:uncharacterized membrane protein YhfC
MDILFYTHFLNGLLMVAFPIGLGIILTRRFNLGWRLWGIGAAGFIISQVGHIPFNSLLTWLFQKGIIPPPPAAWLPFFNPVVLGLSAGLWEELTRYSVFRWCARDVRSWRKGILMGAGHGGIEAILLGGLVLYTFLNLVNIRTADLSQIVPASQLSLAEQQVLTYWSTPWPATLLGAVERIFTIPCQIAFAVLVLQVFTRRKFYWVGLAVLWHAILDAVAVYLSGQWAAYPWGAYALEGVIGLAALISIGIIFILRQPEPVPAVQEPAKPAPTPVSPEVKLVVQETPENIDKTRYL